MGSGRKIGLSNQSPGSNGQLTWQVPGGKGGREPEFLPTGLTCKRGLVPFSPGVWLTDATSPASKWSLFIPSSSGLQLTCHVIVTSVRKGGEDKDSFKL